MWTRCQCISDFSDAERRVDAKLYGDIVIIVVVIIILDGDDE